jgi:hypothetical protein
MEGSMINIQNGKRSREYFSVHDGPTPSVSQLSNYLPKDSQITFQKKS